MLCSKIESDDTYRRKRNRKSEPFAIVYDQLAAVSETKKTQVLNVLISIMKTHELFLVTDSNKVNIANSKHWNMGCHDWILLFSDVNADIRQHRGMPFFKYQTN